MTRQHALNYRFVLAGTAIACSALLAGCAPVIVGSAAATTAMVAADPRTAGDQLSDKEIDLKAANQLSINFGNTARINASSYNGVVLLTGDAFSESIRAKAAQIVAEIPNVRSVVNRTAVGPLASFSQITSDTWLASKVRTTLIATEGIPSNSVKLTVERDNVYLQGMVTREQADRIARLVSSIAGVKEVFTLFDILTPEQAERLRTGREPVTELPPSNPSPTGAVGTSPAGGTSTVGEPAPNSPSVAPVMEPSSPQPTPI